MNLIERWHVVLDALSRLKADQTLVASDFEVKQEEWNLSRLSKRLVYSGLVDYGLAIQLSGLIR